MYGPTPPPWPPSAPSTPSMPPAPAAYPWPQAALYPGQVDPTPPRSLAVRIGLFVLRTVLAVVPLVSVGMLSWVPLLRVALVRRRPWDWILMSASVVVAGWAFVAVGSSTDQNSLQVELWITALFLLAPSTTVYFLIMELRRPRTPHPVPYPAPYPQPLATPWPTPVSPPEQITPLAPVVPLGQVQAELDELSALLRGHAERPAP